MLGNGLTLHKDKQAIAAAAALSAEKQEMHREPSEMDLCHHQCLFYKYLYTEIFRPHFNLY